MSLRIPLFPSLVLCLLWSSAVPAGSETVAILHQVGAPGKRIAGLSLDGGQLRVSVGIKAQTMDAAVRLKGTYARAGSGWILMLDNKQLVPEPAQPGVPDGEGAHFEAPIPLRGERTLVELVAVGPSGELEQEAYEVRYAGWDELQRAARGLSFQKPFIALGLSSISFSDSRGLDVSQLAIEPKASYSQLVFTPRVELGASAFGTLLPFGASSGSSVRLVGAEIHGGYFPPWIDLPWKVGLLAGGQYLTSITTVPGFGFKRLISPTVALSVQRDARGSRLLAAYLQAAPTRTEISARNSHLAGGIAVGLLQLGEQTIAATLDFNRIRLELRDVAVSASDLRLGLSFHF